MKQIEPDMFKQYGVLLGRFQPVHKGHESLVKRIINANHVPVIGIGSSQIYGTDKNPFTFRQRVRMWKATQYANFIPGYLPVKDYPGDDEEWVANLLDKVQAIGLVRKNTRFFVHKKDEDLDPEGNHYIGLLVEAGWDVIELPDMEYKYNATTIRQDIKVHASKMSPGVYYTVRSIQNDLGVLDPKEIVLNFDNPPPLRFG